MAQGGPLSAAQPTGESGGGELLLQGQRANPRGVRPCWTLAALEKRLARVPASSGRPRQAVLVGGSEAGFDGRQAKSHPQNARRPLQPIVRSDHKHAPLCGCSRQKLKGVAFLLVGERPSHTAAAPLHCDGRRAGPPTRSAAFYATMCPARRRRRSRARLREARRVSGPRIASRSPCLTNSSREVPGPGLAADGLAPQWSH
jgi:hypothetical protein